MNETENVMLIVDRVDHKVRELYHSVIGMVIEKETLRTENARLARINAELEAQMCRMMEDKACTGCDWRNQDGKAHAE